MHQQSGNFAPEWSCTSPGTALSAVSTSLSTLLDPLNFSCLQGDPTATVVNTISVDSRNCREDALFIALCGEERDGHHFIPQAMEQGCRAFLVERGRYDGQEVRNEQVVVIEVADTRAACALVAEQVFAHPATEVAILGITGTNGKTTISYLLESVLAEAGERVGIIGTVSYRYQDQDGKLHVIPAPFTTPEPLLLQSILKEMVDAGVDSIIMEVSSHGLSQNRIGGLQCDVAAFTNLSRDHLDYHADMEDYFQAKSLLFTKHLKEEGKAVITCAEEEENWSSKLAAICNDLGLSTMTCGQAHCDIFPLTSTTTLQQTDITLQTANGIFPCVSPLVGSFNIMNLQTTFAMALAAGVSEKTICDGLANATGAPGRLQRIAPCPGEEALRPTVFVDYAHTPDALLQVLQTLKGLPHERLLCVFGCGGDRDQGKRVQMGKICASFADIAVITDDNPRTEDPDTIRAMIAEGVKETKLPEHDLEWLTGRDGSGKGYVTVPNRADAINFAIQTAGKGDIVLIAGKGHEDYQITAAGKHFFDDSLEAKAALSSWKVETVAAATGGTILSEGVEHHTLGNVDTDSRTIENNDIFVALEGERFDGHSYTEQVEAAGAGCLVVHRRPEQHCTAPVVLVDNTEKALGKMAAYRRTCMQHWSQPVVVGITGSSGKTTLKEMCYSIFTRQWDGKDSRGQSRVLKTAGNFNNTIGLPLSLLPITPSHLGVLLEMGMNRPGEIEWLTKIADPDIACINNVHGAHLQGLGTIEGVAKAKGELFMNCRPDTILIVNNDDHRVVSLAEQCKQKKVVYGWQESGASELDIYATAVEAGRGETVQFVLHVEGEQTTICLPVPGLHNVSNALAAAAISHAAGIALEQIAEGLEAFAAADSRMQIVDGPAGVRIINDCYNANPESMRAGLKTLAGFTGAPRVAVLADMLELGENAATLHQELGRFAAESGIEFLALLGDHKEDVLAGAQAAEKGSAVVRTFIEQKSCMHWLQELIDTGQVGAGSYILVKGSRGMRLENLVNMLRGEQA